MAMAQIDDDNEEGVDEDALSDDSEFDDPEAFDEFDDLDDDEDDEDD
jgi:hypothetical protein